MINIVNMFLFAFKSDCSCLSDAGVDAGGCGCGGDVSGYLVCLSDSGFHLVSSSP